jgi:soluble lytic murein transglycosylase-like protein
VYLHSTRIDTLQFHTPPAVIEQCIADAAHDYGLHPQLVRAVLNVEGGRVGSVSRNSNGSSDLGLMQINTTWLPALRRFHVNRQDLTDKPCVNIRVGSWILANKIKGEDDYWVGVGNYHSKTPTYNRRYRQRVYHELERLMSSTEPSKTADLPGESLITMR